MKFDFQMIHISIKKFQKPYKRFHHDESLWNVCMSGKRSRWTLHQKLIYTSTLAICSSFTKQTWLRHFKNESSKSSLPFLSFLLLNLHFVCMWINIIVYWFNIALSMMTTWSSSVTWHWLQYNGNRETTATWRYTTLLL